jgi:nickel transport system substrate-binding protein
MKKAIDEAISQVLTTVDESRRQETYRFILSTIHDQAVYLPISYTAGVIVHGDNLSNVDYGATKHEIPFENMIKK